MCADASRQAIGTSSATPHETRTIAQQRKLTLPLGDGGVRLDLRDTPGIERSVNASTFHAYGIATPAEARARALQATQGILSAIQGLDRIDGMLLVADATRPTDDPALHRLVAHAHARRIGLVLAANKVDLPEARPGALEEAFPRARVVPVSALTGHGMDDLYAAMVDVFG